MKKTLFLLSLAPLLSFCQPYDLTQHGTYIISMISKEGIIVGADSRTCNLEDGPRSSIYGYADGCQKIYIHDGIFIQMAGISTFDNYTFYGLFKKFIATNKMRLAPSSYYSEFIKFANKYLSSSAYKDLTNNDFLISGYSKSEPCIYYYSSNKADSAIGAGFFTNLPKHNIDKSIISFVKNSTIGEKAIFIDQIIKQLSTSTTFKGSIGGPTSIAYVLPNGMVIDKIQKKYNYYTKKEYAIAALNDKIKTIYRSKEDSIIYKNSLRLYLKNRK